MAAVDQPTFCFEAHLARKARLDCPFETTERRKEGGEKRGIGLSPPPAVGPLRRRSSYQAEVGGDAAPTQIRRLAPSRGGRLCDIIGNCPLRTMTKFWMPDADGNCG
jgi:hypothetical protein